MELSSEIVSYIISFIPIGEHLNIIRTSKWFYSEYKTIYKKLEDLNELNYLYDQQTDKFDLHVIRKLKARTSVEALCFALWCRNVKTDKYYREGPLINYLKTFISCASSRNNPNWIKFLFIKDEIYKYLEESIDYEAGKTEITWTFNLLNIHSKNKEEFLQRVKNSDPVETFTILWILDGFQGIYKSEVIRYKYPLYMLSLISWEQCDTTYQDTDSTFIDFEF